MYSRELPVLPCIGVLLVYQYAREICGAGGRVLLVEVSRRGGCSTFLHLTPRTRRTDDAPQVTLARWTLVVSGPQREKQPNMVEIPKAAVIERIRRRSGPEAADSANDELPDKLDLDSDADTRLLRRYDIEPDELREEFGGGSPSTG